MWFRSRSKKNGDSDKALEDAEQNLRDVQKRGLEVSFVANALKEIRERNHFAEELENIIVRPRRS